MWYTVYDMLKFELVHSIEKFKFENSIRIIDKYKIQIHTLVCFTNKHIMILLLLISIVSLIF